MPWTFWSLRIGVASFRTDRVSPDGTSILQDVRTRDNFLFTVASGSNSAQKIDLTAKGGPKIVAAASFGDGANPYNIFPLDDDQAIVTNRQTNSIAAAQWVVVR